MTDFDDQIRDVLRRKADALPPHLEVPRSLAGRARRRIALNAVAAGLAVLVATVGALAGARALSPERGPIVPGRHPSHTQTPHPAPATLPCTDGQLRAVGSMQGAAGSREGAISLTNLSSDTCTLEGTPAITLLDPNLNPITSGIRSGDSPPGWMVDGSPQPNGWPVVTLAPGDVASVRVSWSNWCPDGRRAPLWRVGIHGSSTVDVNGFDAVPPPPCNGRGEPSKVEVGPFEPGAGGP
jgi:Protein of unknown function (DUF4232)